MLHAHPRCVEVAAGPRAKASLLHGRALWLHGSALQLLHGRPWRAWLLHGRPGRTRLLHGQPGWAWLLHCWPQRAQLLHWWPRRTRLLPALLLWASWRWWPHATHGRRGRPHVSTLRRHARLTRVGLLLQGGGGLLLLLLLLSPAAGDCAKHTACSQLRQSCADIWRAATGSWLALLLSARLLLLPEHRLRTRLHGLLHRLLLLHGLLHGLLLCLLRLHGGSLLQ